MAKIILAFTLLSVLYEAMQSGQPPSIGIVNSKSGEPISEVLVCTSSYTCTKTDSDGYFDPAKVLPKQPREFPKKWLFRFSKEGYRPLIETPASDSSRFEVTLAEGDVIPWVLPACRDNGLREGFNIKVLVPHNTQVSRVKSSDYGTISFRFGSTDEWMQIGSGLTWSTGLPFKEDLDRSFEISDRDIRHPRAPVENRLSLDGIDVRGRLGDGKRWRFTGHAFETLTYRNVSPDAAKFFDSIIDGGCFQLSRKELK